MNQAQKQVLATQLKSEEQCLKDLEAAYTQALKDINAEVKRLSGKEQTKSVVYQLNYQKALQAQVSAILDNMQKQQYGTLSEYLQQCYQDGYIGAMYGISSQGIPITMPIQQDQVVYAVQTDSKLSKDLYSSMGKYLKPLKKAVTQELSRGLASSMHWLDIARNIENRSKIGYSNAARIARTEGHRIQSAAKLDAMTAAKQAGADVVKQWDATLDGSTRKSHRKLDGQIREIDEPFEVDGHKAMAPGKFGRPEEDINCRCAVLERARWALDDDELETLKKRAEYFGLDKSKTFADYKKKYLKASEGLDSTKKLQDAIKMAEEDEREAAKKDAIDQMNLQIERLREDLSAAEEERRIARGGPAKTRARRKAQKIRSRIEMMQERADGIRNGTVEVRYKSGERLSDTLKAELARANAMRASGDATALKKIAKRQVNKAIGSYTSPRKFDDAKESYDAMFPSTKKLWGKMSEKEKQALIDYTGVDYQQINGRLRDFSFSEYGWDEFDEKIINISSALDKTSLDNPMWVRRGCKADGIAALFNVDEGDLASADVQSAMIGHRIIEHGFMSTACSSDRGFDGIDMRILLPSGTKGIYCEPFAKAGDTTATGEVWDGESATDSISNDNEFLLQRGSVFEVEDIIADNDGNIKSIVLRLVDQAL